MKPTESGYYWARWSDRVCQRFGYDATPQVVCFQLRTEWMEDDEPDEPRVWLTGSEVAHEVDAFEWISGPLDVHEPPTLDPQRQDKEPGCGFCESASDRCVMHMRLDIAKSESWRP